MNIESLRDRVSPRQRHRTLVVAAVLAVAFVATGVRGPDFGGKGAKLFADDKLNPILAARDAARRKQSNNNLKMIGLAIHNYHDLNKSFPPAVVMGGKDKKVPHSWRVELLRFLDEPGLYAQYNMDEPWDSETNKKVLEKMPNVFRNPNDASGKTNASYFAITGKGTPFEGDQGIRFPQVTDGTSNTLLIVEAKRDIPWTKPEDISYDAEKDPPKLGGHFAGGFHAALCDGSVRFVPGDVDKKTLQHLIEIADGNPVKVPEAGAPRNALKPKMAAKKKGAKPAGDAASAQQQSVQNLRVIALALHNYHDLKGRFPAAVVMGGPDKKVPHSWRVEILQFVDEPGLYARYKMDEPWDSENNKKVLEKIPKVFANPADSAGTTNSSYYVISGKGAIFGPGEGTKMAQIKDGTTNTILVVESKGDIPWTKPEDIAYDAEKDLPKIGGILPDGFNAAMGDGSTQSIPGNTDAQTLKHLIEMADGK